MSYKAERNKSIYAWLLAILISLLLATSAGVGYWLGNKTISADEKIEQIIAYHEQSETLGGLLSNAQLIAELSPRQREQYHQAYLDPSEAQKQVNQFSWSVPNTLTPFLGSAPRPGEHANASINTLQFRDRRELAIPKPQNTVRIFFTGGSTAFGAGAPAQERTIGAYLEQYLNQQLSGSGRSVEVFTFANPAWASTHERIAIVNRLSELDPDLVISFSGNNDVFWAYAGRDILWFRTFSDELYWQLSKQAYLDNGRAALPDVVKLSEQPIAPSQVAQHLLKNIRISHFALALHDIPYIFVLQPILAASAKTLSAREQEFLNDQQKNNYYQEAYQLFAKRLAKLELDQFALLNLISIFDQLPASEEVFIDWVHFGDKGNAIIAQAIANDAAFLALLGYRLNGE